LPEHRSTVEMRTLATLLEQACSTYGEGIFLVYPTGADDTLREQSYAEFLAGVRTWAAFLTARGVQPGDRVGIITPKSPAQIQALYAAWWAGAIAVPICETLGDLEMGFIIRDSEPRLLLIDASMRSKASANCGDVPVHEFDDLPAAGAASACPSPVARQEEDVAALIYTSGSTGMPKGVMLTHRNLYVNAACAAEVFRISPRDRVISLLPYWHAYALVCEVLTFALCGAQTAIPRDMRDFKRNIRRYQPTFILVVPRIADALMSGIQKRIAESPERVQRIFAQAIHNASRIFTAGPRLDGGLLRMLTHHAVYDPLVFRKIRANLGGRLRFFVSGGAPLDIEHQIFFKYLGVPVYQGYGLTESAPIVSSNLPERHKLGSSGPIFPWLTPERGGDYTFRDSEGRTGKEVHGELLVKGDCVMKGYWRHTDASAKTLADGWLHTGDIGYVDADGFLFLEGRQGNMIVLEGGEKLHPEHVEDALKTSPLITECMVIGEKCKNVYALVNVDADRTAGLSGAPLLERLRKEVQEKSRHLASYQKPKDVLIVPDFSMDEGTLTATLKVRRHMVWQKHGEDIRRFLAENGEETATKQEVGIASSKVMESLGRA